MLRGRWDGEEKEEGRKEQERKKEEKKEGRQYKESEDGGKEWKEEEEETTGGIDWIRERDGSGVVLVVGTEVGLLMKLGTVLN